MNKGNNNIIWSFYKKPTLLAMLALGFLVSCSDDQNSQSVSKQKVDNPTAANDRAADSSYKPNKTTSNNPFIQPSEESVRVAEDNDEVKSDENQYDYSFDEQAIDEQAYMPDTVVFQGNDSGYIEWQAPVEVAYSTADVVVITPSGERLNRSYSSGEPMVLDENLPDGLYLWESIITPEVDQYAMEEMAQVRESGNLNEEQALMQKLRDQGSIPTASEAHANKQSGAFLVVDGVATSIEEANKAADQLQREDG